jgi:hypothetical protein
LPPVLTKKNALAWGLGVMVWAISGCDEQPGHPATDGGGGSTSASTTTSSTATTTAGPSTSSTTSSTGAGGASSGASGAGGTSGTGGTAGSGGVGGAIDDASTIVDASPEGGDFPADAAIGSCIAAKWTASASVSAATNPPSQGIDGIPVSRWSTGAAQTPGQYYQVDFGGYVRLSRITLDSTGNQGDHPRAYKVEVSSDGNDFSETIADGALDDLPHDVVTIDFAPRAVRFLRIESTGTSGSWWSIHELTASCQLPDGDGGWFTDMPPPDPDLCSPDDAGSPSALNRVNWHASASATNAADPVANAIDGSETTRWSTGKAQAGDEWFKLDLGSVGCFGHLSMTSPGTDFPIAYAIFVSIDDAKYTVVASAAGQSSLMVSFPPHSARYVRVNQYGLTGSWWSINEIGVQK